MAKASKGKGSKAKTHTKSPTKKKAVRASPKKTAKRKPLKKAAAPSKGRAAPKRKPLKKAAPSKKRAKKPLKKATASSKSSKGKISSAAKQELSSTLKKMLTVIKEIKAKGTKTENEVSSEQKKMFATNDPTKKLMHFFQMEGLKIESFSKVEHEVKELSQLLNKAYAQANKMGGLIRDDFLNVCQDLSKGINLDLMEKDILKMQKDLK